MLFLNSHAASQQEFRADVAVAVRAIAAAALKVRAIISNVGPGATHTILPRGGEDPRSVPGTHAAAILLDAMRDAPVASYLDALDGAEVSLDPQGTLAVAVHPLDGISNIDINAALGTIFSVLPARHGGSESSFLQTGRRQLAAGFFVYGPQLGLALTLGNGTHVFVFSASMGVFVQAWDSCAIPPDANEYAINASNYRHWNRAVRLYIDDCLSGVEGPRHSDFDMRWGASLVAHIYRILMRGGIYLEPADNRKGFSQGRLGLIHQANPIAMLVEHAGGRATDAIDDILDRIPDTIDQRTPLVCGSVGEVDRIARYHTDPSLIAERAPLFGNRGLFRH
ncbi:MAG: class 1 fructose-bisphosphatase [Hyphomicrobiales bacterium]|nr:class 1 fructose-bisphosphatase [Hyphomicrobiales bacterium]